MTENLKNRQWKLIQRPVGDISADDLRLVESDLQALKPGEVRIRNIYLSLDPTHRIWMSDRDQYLPPVGIGEVMRGGVLGEVVESRSERIAPGDIVKVGLGGWETYSTVSDRIVQRVHRTEGLPLTAYMSVLGSTGMTAWFGMTDIGRPQAGETVVVSAAAGAVGSIAGQVAKAQGARVIGIAGGEEKCRWIVNGLGFDGAIDYKRENVGEALDRLCPDGIDVNFENVGGDIMDAVISRMNNFGRVALCGMISTYNQPGPARGPSDFSRILMRRILIKGFIVIDYMPRAREAMDGLGALVREGRLKWKTHVVDGLENAPEAVNYLFAGKHDGKLLVRVSPET